jgi:hypothetical protein
MNELEHNICWALLLDNAICGKHGNQQKQAGLVCHLSLLQGSKKEVLHIKNGS